MSLQARVAELDDYTGELGQELRKLEMERSHNALNADEELDFLGDLHKAAYARRLAPWRKRARGFLFLGLAAAAAAGLIPTGLSFHAAIQAGLLLLALAGVVAFGWCLAVFLRKRQWLERWMRRMEDAVAAGGSIFDTD